MKLRCVVIAILLFSTALYAQPKRIPLHGEWTFGLDPVNVGIEQEWFQASFSSERWDKVTVPHCYSIDPRYHYYTGTAWYFKRFSKVTVPDGSRVFVRFEAVFYKTHVWLNGKAVGEHEGGYTPFEVDITDALSSENLLTLRVNNAWDTTTIPGAKTKVDFQGANSAQLYPWINYGGINREVNLIIRPAVYVKNMKVAATPDLNKKTAALKFSAYLKNTSAQPFRRSDVQAAVYQGGRKIPVKLKSSGADIAAGADGAVVFEGMISGKDVKLWSPDDPVLYKVAIIAGADTLTSSFGIRSIEIKGTQLLLNGEPIRMGGCNRPLDYPGHGSMDPQEVMEKDLTLIKSGSMELSRINHYPVSPYLLEWADAHGLLIIAEAGNWQMTPKQMADATMRRKFQSQMREMVERDWNHPSVIAWSVGNEYQSHTSEGQAWTKDMYAFTKSMDPTRLVTFASMFVFRPIITKPEDEASHYVDFVSANIYGDHLNNLNRIHALYPNKPVYISEFGLRTDNVKSEQDRVNHLKKAMEDFRKCDFLIGASVWTFNDYQSYFPGSNANGYRPWGLVSPEREPRDMYFTWQEEFSPATIDVQKSDGKKLTVTVTARKDFPSYTLRNYKLLVSGQSFALPVLKPGESNVFTVDVGAIPASDKSIALVKPGGFVIVKKSY